MKAEVIMPKVDMDQETGTLVEWLKQEGDSVKKGEPLFVILTSKAAIEIEAPETGILRGITAKKDDVIPVTEVIAYIVSADEKFEMPAVTAVSRNAAETASTPVALPVATSTKPAENLTEVSTSVDSSQVRATPLARAIARDKGLDLSIVPGRGPRGRIYKSDVLSALEKGLGATRSKPATISGTSAGVPAMQIPLPNARIRERIPMKGIRQVIAQRLSYSWSTIPHIYETVTVNMEEVVRLRERVNEVIQAQTGLKVSYTAILALAVTRLLPKHPSMNSSFTGEEVIIWDDVNLGIATSLEDYLIVPVIRNAQEKNLEGLVKEMNRLLESARNKRMEPADMSGSTFTITNLGMFGIESFTAIINPPETAILAVGKMTDAPVVINGQVVIRPMMSLTIAVDHRVNDGARAAKFLTELKATLENPYLLI
jgi:pyruvate dehydrogenase E2 component (dihydrolipoamide acetyltransferase)